MVDWAKYQVAVKMLARVGLTLEMVNFESGMPDLVVLGFGSGIVMAAVDHLLDRYPWLGIAMADMNGEMGLERRCIAIDYIAAVAPTLLLQWSGLLNADAYPRFLQERAFDGQRLAVYVQGNNALIAEKMWRELGATIVPRLWGPSPLGNWLPRQTSRHGGFRRRESQWG